MRSQALLALVLAAGIIAPAPVEAQQFRVAPTFVWMTNSEIGEDLEFSGIGGGLAASFRTGRIGVSAEGMWTSLDSGDKAATKASYDVKLWDLRATYRVIPGLDAMLGAQARSIDPEFTAQNVGVFRIGLASETRISRLADIGVRAAWLPFSDFNGGGDAGFGFEVGMGVTVGGADGRYRALVSYDFQRIDRTVKSADVPIQLMIARLGFQLGF